MATTTCHMMVTHTMAEAASGHGIHPLAGASKQMDGGQIDASEDAEKLMHHPRPEDELIMIVSHKAAGAPHGMKAFAGCRGQLVAMDMAA